MGENWTRYKTPRRQCAQSVGRDACARPAPDEVQVGGHGNGLVVRVPRAHAAAAERELAPALQDARRRERDARLARERRRDVRQPAAEGVPREHDGVVDLLHVRDDVPVGTQTEKGQPSPRQTKSVICAQRDSEGRAK